MKTKSIRINYNELQHQDLLIQWIFQHNKIISYETERELKSYDYLLEQNKLKKKSIKKGYPDLLVHYENKDMIVELERTRKSKERFERKLDSYYKDLQVGKEILWLVPNENMKKFVDEQIKAYDFKNELHHIEIFNINN